MSSKKPLTHRPLNNRQRLVLINALKGMNQTESYKAVYGQNQTPMGIQQSASTLFRNPVFKAELERLQAKELEKVEKTLLSRNEKRQILAEIARASLVDHLDDTGDIKLNRKKAKALKEYYTRTRLDNDGQPLTTKSLKLIDPITAIQEDNKMTGDYAPVRHQVAKRVEFDISFRARQSITSDDSDIIEGSTTDADR